jgi:hypothetical protein
MLCFVVLLYWLLHSYLLFVMLNSVFTLFSLRVLCICSCLICFLTQFLCATYISWRVSYLFVDGRMFYQWNACVYVCMHVVFTLIYSYCRVLLHIFRRIYIRNNPKNKKSKWKFCSGHAQYVTDRLKVYIYSIKNQCYLHFNWR